MTTNNYLPLEQFTFVVDPPEMRMKAYYVSIYADGRFNLNGRLADKLSRKPLQIRFNRDGTRLCLLETAEERTMQFPKNGSKKLPDAVAYLKKQKILIPARYTMGYSEEYRSWQGVLEENPTFSQASGHSNTKRK